jgi:hypothetical protein
MMMTTTTKTPPPPPANVGESSLVPAVWRAEGDFLDGLVDDEALE